MSRIDEVDPGDLRLAPGRQDGAVPTRYYDQLRRFGTDFTGMPPIEVTEGKDGEMMINNGVTRAMRAYYVARRPLIQVEVAEVRPRVNFSRLKRVRDLAPPP